MKKLIVASLLCGLSVLALNPGRSMAQTISTVAGCGIGDDSLATKAELVGPVGVAVDMSGNTYIVDGGSYRVRKVNASGIITTFAGTGVYGYTGDGGPATAAKLGVLYGITVDRHNNVFVVDNSNNCIRKIDPSGIISTVCGDGTAGYSGDGGPATAAQLQSPIDIVADTIGNLYFTDWANYVARKIDTAGIITTVVGDGALGSTGAGGPATDAELGGPFRITIDKNGNLYVAEVFYQYICKVDPSGILTIIGGTGAYGAGTDGDGGMATAAIMTSPCGLAVDTSGHLYFSDIGNDRIRMINLNTGIVSAYAASGIAGYSGDGGLAIAGEITTPEGLACDAAGNLLICDADNNRVRKVITSGIITTFAGQNGLFGEGYPATNAEMCIPTNLASDAAGNIYIADYYNNRIRKLDAATGIITTVAGSGIAGYDDGFSGDGGPATLAHIYNPIAVAVDNAGNMYIADENNQRIRVVSAAGIISTLTGDGTAAFLGNNAPALGAELNTPTGIAVDNSGNIFIADQQNNRIRVVDSFGIIRTYAGSGFAGYGGDSSAATMARLNAPSDVATDGMGNVYIADAGNNRIRKVDTAGIITTVAGTTIAGFSGDGGPAVAAQLSFPFGIKADHAGNLFIADAGNERIRKVNAFGTITTVAGSGTAGFAGDGGPAIAAQLNNPTGIAVDPSGMMYIADGNNFRIRKLDLALSVPDVNNNRFADVKVYPIPSNGKLNILDATGCHLTVYDLAGRELLRTEAISAHETMDISNLADGTYFLQLTNNMGERRVIKVTKE